MIKYGISESSVIPVRKEPNDRSEMVTQLLFGETFEILEETIKWTFVKLSLDHYTGWIDNKEIRRLSEGDFNSLNEKDSWVTKELFTEVKNSKDERLILPAGCSIPNFDKSTNHFNISNRTYQIINKQQDDLGFKAVCMQFLNAPYLGGGKNPMGIDCSGFTQVIFKIFGVDIPRDASNQVKEGENINFISDTQTGDLAFFDDEEGNIYHVGIILDNNTIIHASGKVRIDKIDQQGINNLELKKYTYKLRVIKRILN